MSASNVIKDRKGVSIARMWQSIAATLTTIVLVATAVPAHAFLARPVIFAALGGAIKAPSGWLQFCSENPNQCRPSPDVQHDVVLTPDLLQQLFTINTYANNRVKWTSDLELYGKAERWALPLDRGDCENIVLLKRRLLSEAGWPIGSLLITTVEEPHAGGRHAVLTVRTDRGEFILDNQTPEVLFSRGFNRPEGQTDHLRSGSDCRGPSARFRPVLCSLAEFKWRRV